MNEALKTALNEARALAEAARTAAEAGNPEEARRLLAELDAMREECAGGNAAASASRAKTLRIEAEALALLDTAQPEADEGAAEAAPLHAPEQPVPAEVEPAAVNEAPLPEVVPVALPAPTKARAPRGTAPAHSLSADEWSRVAAALRAQGADIGTLDAETERFTAQMEQARIERNTFRARVMERQALQARLEAAALRGDLDAANAAWDRLFDVVTAIRSMEGTHRRKTGQADPEKAAAYDAAREASLKVRRWARGVDAAA